jgi:hypothetical protein
MVTDIWLSTQQRLLTDTLRVRTRQDSTLRSRTNTRPLTAIATPGDGSSAPLVCFRTDYSSVTPQGSGRNLLPLQVKGIAGVKSVSVGAGAPQC